MPNYSPKVPNLSAEELTVLRSKYKDDKAIQNALGPIEHGKFVESLITNGSPLQGIAAALASPLWTGFKLANQGVRNLGYTEKDFPIINKYLERYGGESFGQRDWSDPSLAEIAEAYKGLARGLSELYRRR